MSLEDDPGEGREGKGGMLPQIPGDVGSFMHPSSHADTIRPLSLCLSLTQTTHMWEQAANYWTRAREARQTQRRDGLGWARRPSAASAATRAARAWLAGPRWRVGAWVDGVDDLTMPGAAIGQGRGGLGRLGGQPPHLSTGVCSVIAWAPSPSPTITHLARSHRRVAGLTAGG